MNTFYIHFNCDRPFKVVLYGKNVFVYREIDRKSVTMEKILTREIVLKDWIDLEKFNFETFELEDIDILYRFEKEPMLKFLPKEIYLGKSDDGHEGNTILLDMGNLQYIYIGRIIYSFITYAPIVCYLSQIGNNDVPYAYAIDTYNNYYLMEFGTVMKNLHLKNMFVDPFDYYTYECDDIDRKYIECEPILRKIICSDKNSFM